MTRLSLEWDRIVHSLSPHLQPKKERFWTAAGDTRVSYPEEGHDDYAAIEMRSYWFSHRNRCITAVVRRFAPTGPILDVGGGNGIVSLALHQAGFASLVLEPGRRGAETAHERGLPVIQATLEEARLTAGSVCAAGLFDVLEHIEDDIGTLNALRHLIREAGLLYMTVPAFHWLWSQEDTAAGHARRYTLSLLQKRLNGAGFDILYATYLFSVLVPPILLLRTLPSTLGMGAQAKRTVAADHMLPPGPIGAGIARALDWEARRVEQGRRVPIGSSILLAARRRPR